jgi:oligogalacturonide transport system substrate-binding protein
MQGRGGGLFEWVSNIHLAGGNFQDNDQDARRMDGVGVALLPSISAGTTQNSMQRTSLVHAVTQAAVDRGVEHVAAYFLNFLYTDDEALRALGDAFGIPLSRTASNVAAELEQTWGLMAEGLELLVANPGEMCHLFEDPDLRPARRAAFEAFHSGSISAREAAERWVNDQQAYLNAR